MVGNTAERDIRTFSDSADIKAWLVRNGFISDDSENFTISVVQDWARPGSETYILHFAVEQEMDGVVSRAEYISKACIKIPCTPTMQDWLKRREKLTDMGIATPRLYVAEGASLIEEFIPYTLQEAFETCSDEEKKKLIDELIRVYEQLFANGFRPRIMTDIRSRGDDIVLIDFGEDLGGDFREPSPPYESSEIVRISLGKVGLSLL